MIFENYPKLIKFGKFIIILVRKCYCNNIPTCMHGLYCILSVPDFGKLKNHLIYAIYWLYSDPFCLYGIFANNIIIFLQLPLFSLQLISCMVFSLHSYWLLQRWTDRAEPGTLLVFSANAVDNAIIIFHFLWLTSINNECVLKRFSVCISLASYT